MSVPEDAIWEFKGLYEQEFKEEITLEQAREMATRLLTLYKLLLKQLRKGALPKEMRDSVAVDQK